MLGYISIFIASICAAIHYKANEYLNQYKVLNRVFWQFSIGILMVLLFFKNISIETISQVDGTTLFYVALLAIVCGIGAYGFMIKSVKEVGATITGALDYLEPVVGISLAIILFGERLSLIQIVGWILIMMSLVGIYRLKK